jgi:F-type H+-transporting ATPase subunit b
VRVRSRLFFACLLVGLSVTTGVSLRAQHQAEPQGAPQHEAGQPAPHPPGVPPEGGAQPHDQAAAEGHAAEEQHAEGILPTIARLLNFALLVGLLGYFLKSPIAGYLASRSEQIRADLVQAAAMRTAAEAQLAEIDRKMKALPGELESLRARGAQQVAAEEARIRAAAEADRDRLLEHMRRDIDLQVRIARRDLMEEASALAVAAARQRVLHAITPDDHARLLDRYTAQLRGAR